MPTEVISYNSLELVTRKNNESPLSQAQMDTNLVLATNTLSAGGITTEAVETVFVGAKYFDMSSFYISLELEVMSGEDNFHAYNVVKVELDGDEEIIVPHTGSEEIVMKVKKINGLMAVTVEISAQVGSIYSFYVTLFKANDIDGYGDDEGNNGGQQ